MRPSVAAVVIVVALSGASCKGLLNSLAESGPWGTMLHSAPHVANPATSGAVPTTPSTDQQGLITYRWSSYSPTSLCFAFTAPWAPNDFGGAPWAIEAMVNTTDDRPDVGGSADLVDKNGQVRVIKSTSHVAMVKKYVNGMTIEKPETIYETDAEVCFANPKIPTPTSRYLMLYRDGPVGGFDSYAAWQLDPVAPK